MNKFVVTILMGGCLLLTGCQKDKVPQVSSQGDSQESVVKQQGDNAVFEDKTDNVVSPEVVKVPPTGEVVEIKEKMFIGQSDDIYFNSKEYLGKTIKYEGLIQSRYLERDGMTHYYVVRFSPGCCGADGEVGFEVTWDGEWPEDGEWCEVAGVLEEYPVKSWTELRLVLTSLTVLEERGEDFVTQ